MKLQKTIHFQAMMKKSFFWRFLYENETKWNPSHKAETHTSSCELESAGARTVKESYPVQHTALEPFIRNSVASRTPLGTRSSKAFVEDRRRTREVAAHNTYTFFCT